MSHGSAAVIAHQIRLVSVGTVAQKTTSGSALLVPYPPNIVAGNLLVCCVCEHGAGGIPSMPAGTGFTGGGVGSTTNASGGPAMRVGWRVATGAESGNINFSTFGTVAGSGQCIQLSGVNTTSPQSACFFTHSAAALVTSLALTSASNPTRSGICYCCFVASTDVVSPSNIPPTSPVAFQETADSVGSGASFASVLGINQAPGFFAFTVARADAGRMCAVCIPMNPAE